MSQPNEIRTARLLLRRWRDGDLAPFRAMNADPDVMRYFARPLVPDESDAMAGHFMTLMDAGLGPWAVEIPGEAAFIGYVGALPVRRGLPFAPATEVGWRLDKLFWHRGFATEAARAAVTDFFNRFPDDEIVSFTTRRNEPSMAVMRRLDMKRDPTEDFEHPLVPEGHPNRPHVLYRLSRRAHVQDAP